MHHGVQPFFKRKAAGKALQKILKISTLPDYTAETLATLPGSPQPIRSLFLREP